MSMTNIPSTNRTGPPRIARRWSWWLVPKQFDLVTSLLYISVPVLSALFVSDRSSLPLSWWQLLLMIVAVVSLLSVDRCEYYFYGEITPHKVAFMLMVVRIVLIELVSQLDEFRFSPFLYLMVPLLVSLSFGIVPGYVFMVLAWVVFFVKEVLYKPMWFQSPENVHYLIIYTVGLIFAMAMAHAFLQERCSRNELEESHRQLKEYSDQIEELATTKERNRLARDIHDTLGHYLTVINVQLEKALAFRDKKPQEAELAVSEAKRLASEALRDVRHSVAVLRNTPDTLPLVPSLTALVEHMRTERRDVELTIAGNQAAFSQPTQLTLYHAVQEGLTNIQKHANATHVVVDLRYDDDEATLSLRDNGRGFDPLILQHLPPGREGGYGLLGLQERLQLVGGRLHIDSHPGDGTCLLVHVPKSQYPYLKTDCDSGSSAHNHHKCIVLYSLTDRLCLQLKIACWI